MLPVAPRQAKILFCLQFLLFACIANGKITLRCDDEFNTKYREKNLSPTDTRKSRTFRSVIKETDIIGVLSNRHAGNGTFMKGRLIFEIDPAIRFPVPGLPSVDFAVKDAEMNVELINKKLEKKKPMKSKKDKKRKKRKKKKKKKEKKQKKEKEVEDEPAEESEDEAAEVPEAPDDEEAPEAPEVPEITDEARRKRQASSINDQKSMFFERSMMNQRTPSGNAEHSELGAKRIKNKRSVPSTTSDKCDPTRRVIGGNEVQSIEQFPYMAFINTGCGGAVISPNWIISAAHCVFQESPTLAFVGSVKLHSGCRHDIKEVVIHPQFDMKHLQYDIALIQVVDNFVISRAVQPIKISDEAHKPGTCGIVTGWGAQEFDGTTSLTMQETTLPILSEEQCPKRFKVQTGQFCAGYPDARSDTCQGDSGGPIVVAGVLTGIVSFGYKCAIPDMPGVYVDVSFHRKWITEVAGV